MAKKTARQWIKGLVSKAWEAVKSLPRKIRPKKAEVESKEIKRIAEETGKSTSQIGAVARGERPGNNLVEPLSEIKPQRKRRAPRAAQPSKKATERARRAPKEKPEPEKAAEAPQEIAAPPPPKKVYFSIKGYSGPSSDPEYIRKRTISKTIEGDLAARFAELYEVDEFEALQFATSAYFGSSGEGHLESVIGTPVILYTY